MSSIYVSNLSKICQDSSLATISNAFVSGSHGQVIEITTEWKQNDYVTNTTDLYTMTYNFDQKDDTPQLLLNGSVPKPLQSVLIESMFSSFDMNAVIQKIENKESKKAEYILKVWSRQNREVLQRKVINLSSFDKHEAVHADSVFGSLQWCQDGSKLVYVAERKKPKTLGYYARDNSKDDNVERGDKFMYEESWGELLTDVTNPVICVIDIKQETLEIITEVPENISPAQPQWGPDNSLIFEGIKNQPYRLGRIYCENRNSAIYQINLTTRLLVKLSPSSVLAANYNPRVSLDASKLIFLHNPLSGKGDPHRNYDILMMYDFKNKNLQKVYDDDNTPLFSHSLPEQCWFGDNVHIVLPNIYQSRIYACIINTKTGEMISKVSCSQLFGAYCNGDGMNMVLSSYMKLNSDRDILQVTYLRNAEYLSDLHTYTEVKDYPKNKAVEYGSITDEFGIISHYLLPYLAYADTDNLYPLIVYPHGGPHSVHTDNYNRHASIFCQLGYAVLLANYRGSVGFSKESLMSLPGNIGKQDVEDVHNFTLKFLELDAGSKADRSNIFVFGGSHGGFLGAHLIGQYPEFYRAAALRNPVIDIAAMVMVSDIPDWASVESGLPFTQEELPSSAHYKSMLEKSPIQYACQIKAPLLLLIGEKDQRVPPSQGKGLYRLLKANKKTVKLLLYPNDSHPLSNVETEVDSTINICKWFYTHRKCFT